MSVGHVNIDIGIVVEIKRCRSPRPPRPRHLIIERSLPQTVRVPQIHAISVAHQTSLLLMFREFITAQTQSLQTPCGRGGHAGHVQVHPFVSIEIRKRQRHTKTVSRVVKAVGHVFELSLSVIQVKVQARIVAGHGKIQITVFVEIHERSAVSSTMAFCSQSASDSRLRKPAFAIVQQQKRREPVIGIVVRRRHLAEVIGRFVLGQPDVQVTIGINITCGEYTGKIQLLSDCFHNDAACCKSALVVRQIELRKARRPTQQVHAAVSVEVSGKAGGDLLRRRIRHQW